MARSAKNDSVKEPLVHITKRSSVSVGRGLLIRAAAIVIAFICCGLVAFLLIEKIRSDPGRIVEFYKCFFTGTFSTADKTLKFFKNLAVLLIISLAVTPAFRMRFWNIGAEGQVLMGVLGCIAVAYYCGDAVTSGTLPRGLFIVMMLAGSVLASAIWAVIPSIFKAFWNTNETLFTLMMNYIAISLTGFFIQTWIPNGNSSLGRLDVATLFPLPAQDELAKMRESAASGGFFEKTGLYFTEHAPYLFAIGVAIVITVLLYIYLYYSKHGYEISVVGESENTAKYIGINVKKVTVRTNILCGTICGVAGFLLGAGLNQSVTVDAVGGQGFTAIMVSWLAKFNPAIMPVTSGLVTFLNEGAGEVSTVFDVRGALPNIIVGIILFFVIGCEFFINYKLHFRKSVKKEAES